MQKSLDDDDKDRIEVKEEEGIVIEGRMRGG
jgi:hypothetical protein